MSKGVKALFGGPKSQSSVEGLASEMLTLHTLCIQTHMPFKVGPH